VFVDESYRNGRYLLTAVAVQPSDLRRLRKVVREMLMPGQRELHLKAENPRRRRTLLARAVAAGGCATVYVASCQAREQEAARAACLQRLVVDLVAVGAHRLVMDSRGDRDRNDILTLQSALGAHPRLTGLTYEHLDSAHEPLIGLADMLGWAYGAGGDWQRRVASAVLAVTVRR
jgi:hypothetical protein